MDIGNQSVFNELTEHFLCTAGLGVRFRARGHSMYPHIVDGDIIELQPISIPKIRPGDILLHRTPKKNGVVAHRCVKVVSEGPHLVFYTKGDTAYGKGLKVNAEDIRGIVVSIERNGKRILFYTKSAQIKNRIIAFFSPQGAWIYPTLARIIYLPYSVKVFISRRIRAFSSPQ